MQGAILRKKSGIDGVTAESFEGDAVLVFTTDGLLVEGAYYGERGVFYKCTKADQIKFFAAITDMMSEKLYEMIGREQFIKFQNDFLLKAGDKR